MSNQELLSYAKKQIDQKQASLLDELKSTIKALLEELGDEISNLEEINIDEIKAEEKTKIIVKGNLESFIRELKRLRKNLQQFLEKEEDIENFAQEAHSLLKDFEERTAMNFEKATFLVGKELHEVAKSISSFFKYIDKFKKKNKYFIEAIQIINTIAELNKAKKQKKEAEADLDENIQHIENLVKEIDNKQEEFKKKIEQIRNSPEHKKLLQRKEELKKKHKLEKDKLNELKELINLKRLASIFHFSQKEMSVINEMKTDFYSAYDKYGKHKILDMTSGNKNKETITDKIKEIETIREEIKQLSNSLPEKDKIEEIKEQQDRLKKDKARQLEEKDKLKKKKAHLNEEIKEIQDKLQKQYNLLRETKV